MKTLTNLNYRILSAIEPDKEKWDYWLTQQALAPISQSESMQAFVMKMQEMKDKKQKVLVAGDYDCDGILATTIMMDGLKRFGIECGFYIPDRIREGYGLNCDTVLLASRKGYTCIVTVDNGIKAKEAIALAKEKNMTVIITDHHTIEDPVDCDILVHPRTMEPVFETLCGAAVAYECLRALRIDRDYDLELAAIASIGDVMRVTKETRAIIQRGIESLNRSKEPHVFSLCSSKILDETSIAFQIVPKLNATGRLSNLANVNNIVRYFLDEDAKTIYSFTSQIEEINNRRKQMSQQMCAFAKTKCSQDDDIIFINDESFHEGIIGLVAGSLCSEFQKPVIISTENQTGIKASMRAPEGFNCMEFLEDFDDFSAYGGHAQAAGFSINFQDYQKFRDYIRQRIRSYRWKAEESFSILVDPEDINKEEVNGLNALRPFGPGFECPAFEIKNPQIKSIFDIQKGKHRKFTLQNGLQCMNFNQTEFDRNQSVNSIRSIVGKPQVSDYRGSTQLTFIIDSLVY